MFDQSTADAICVRLADGESLRAICRSDEMPDESEVRKWARDNVQGFYPQYTRAREAGYELMAEEIVEISDEGKRDTYIDAYGNERTDYDVIARSKLRVDTRKWLLAKMLPKVYGDRIAQDVTVGMGEMTDEQLNAAAGRIRTILATEDHRAGAEPTEVEEQAP